MTRFNFQSMNVDQLVQRFTHVALAQDEAMVADDNAKFNRLYSQMEDIRAELKSRNGDQRRALVRLYDHPNPQVRLKAAITTLVLVPEEARRVLQAIVDREEFPQAADALGIVRGLDNGTFIPA